MQISRIAQNHDVSGWTCSRWRKNPYPCAIPRDTADSRPDWRRPIAPFLLARFHDGASRGHQPVDGLTLLGSVGSPGMGYGHSVALVRGPRRCSVLPAPQTVAGLDPPWRTISASLQKSVVHTIAALLHYHEAVYALALDRRRSERSYWAHLTSGTRVWTYFTKSGV